MRSAGELAAHRTVPAARASIRNLREEDETIMVKRFLAAVTVVGSLFLAVPVSAAVAAPRAPATCSATVGGTVTWGFAGNYNAYSTYDNCTTWRAWVICRVFRGGSFYNRYGSWRSVAGQHSVAGCFSTATLYGGGWETSSGQYFRQF